MNDLNIVEIANKYLSSSTLSKYETDLDNVIENIKNDKKLTIILKEENIAELSQDDLSFFLNNSGRVTKLANGTFEIILSPLDGEQRKRFTLAHELGHIVLGHLSGLNDGDDIKEPRNNFLSRSITFDKNSKEEKDANKFAASLLMNENLIEEYLSRQNEMSDSFIVKMANDFNVSKTAMLIRLSFLGYSF